MLPPATRDRVKDAIPQTFPMTVDGTTYNVPLDIWWANEDQDVEDTDHPAVFIEPTMEGVLRDQDQPLTDDLATEDADSDAVSHNVIKGKRLYDEWTITVSDSGQAYGTTASDRVQAATQRLKEWVWFEARDELYTHGPNGELPVLISHVAEGGDASAMVDDRNMRRRVFVIRLQYTYTHAVAVDLVRGFDVSLNDGPLRRITLESTS